MEQPSIQHSTQSENIIWASFHLIRSILLGFISSAVVKNLSANARNAGSISGLGRSPGEGNGNLLQYSCLENSLMGYSPWGCKESHTYTHTQCVSVNPSLSSFSPLVTISLYSISLSLFLFCK